MPVQQSMRGKVLADFADNVVRLSKINLGKTYTAKNSRGKSYKKRIDNSGNLRNSIKAKVKQRDDKTGRFEKANIVWSMLDYGLTVDKGRKAGKGIPMQPLIDWINKKPLKIRDLETGSFIKKTASRVRGLAYVISRNAKENGIAPTNFFTDAFESQQEKYYNDIQEAIAQDQINYIDTQLDTISNGTST
jgi:hypothetical protein